MTGPLHILKDPSFEEFINFIEKQPHYREICHKSWDSDCVGEYMQYTGRELPDILQFIDDFLDGLSQPLEGFDYVDVDNNNDNVAISVMSIFQLLNEANPIQASGIPLSTYGSLDIILKAHLTHYLEESLTAET